ncbi:MULTISPECIES: shikimate transporter [Brenneria]|uniref:Shikimate transporter n=1 Tax=Brenneria nigrifluens DSM 30175 = ATCC 13028 TaxID=1121120 RepID=A0A2U1UDP9_9GAMM|nr:MULTISPECIES: shikimate transporter [Brenneria]EHD23518.1 metabolite/H+ symporter, major facilitator superfamily (MFS) [Brenneria sp. EniD312]PWC19788.1 shikimate transporter [Brenneria nigrifluens] [Brenneria nigrifluens DSM 30175 = ATCC 13028]QCR06445.1 shikimate transporter [Brenneria nigrifluens] [Brenneria nigrifluens DSM 30175 = ATCC 13028]
MDSSTTSIPTPAAKDAAPVAPGRARRAAWGSFIGAVVDWYDFLLYGIVAALVFNIEFFPQISPTMGTLAAFGTFGVGFLFRPLGGIVFGHYGDKLGRKRMLMITVWTMGLSTALIGLLPTFDSIGWWAPVLLVTLRAIQGFAVGGEWGGAALLAVENAPKKKKAFYSSGVQVGYGVGLLLATGSISLVSHHTTDADFISWGWRLPFLFSVVLVAIAWWIRSGMEESLEFEANKKLRERTQKIRSFPIVEALRKHPKAFLLIIALRLGELLTMYIVTAFALNYSTANLGMSREFFLHISLLVGGISCLSIPLFARLADSFGRRRIYVTGALIGAASAFPFFMALEAHASLWILFFAIMLANVAHDMIVSVQQPMFTELFGTAYRYSGAGVGYQVASVVGGGFTPFIAVLLVEFLGGSWHGVATYLAVGCLLSAIVGMRMKPQTLD